MEFIPKWIAWEVTRRCNLNCIHCRSSSELIVKGHPEPTLQECFTIIDSIASYAKPVVVLSGGEPLLRDDIFEIAKYGSCKGLRMCLATNGSLVTEELCKQIKDSQIKIVSMSLDGASKDVHDDFRKQKGAFEGVLQSAELFKKHGIEFIINSSFTKRNQADIPAVYQLAKRLGATAWYLFMIVPTGRAEDVLDELISTEDYDRILKWHYEMEKNEKDLLVRPTCAPHYYRLTLQEAQAEGIKYERRNLKFSTGGSKGCLAGQLICLINVDGDVLPCSYFPLKAGNIKTQSFKDIWENSELFADLRNFKAYKGKCGKCEYLKICGGCRARAYALKGDYLAEEPFCRYIPNAIKK